LLSFVFSVLIYNILCFAFFSWFLAKNLQPSLLPTVFEFRIHKWCNLCTFFREIVGCRENYLIQVSWVFFDWTVFLHTRMICWQIFPYFEIWFFQNYLLNWLDFGLSWTLYDRIIFFHFEKCLSIIKRNASPQVFAQIFIIF